MKSGDSHFQDGVSPNLFLSKTFGKRNPFSLKEASKSLENPLLGMEGEQRGRSIRQSLIIVFVIRFLAQPVSAMLKFLGRKQQQVMRRWTFLQMLKPGTEGRKGKAG